MAAVDGYGQTLAPRLTALLDAHEVAWLDGHRAACVAHRRGEQSAELLDRRMACLGRGRSALGALASLIAAADVASLPSLAVAALSCPIRIAAPTSRRCWR